MFCVPLADKGELAGAKGCKKNVHGKTRQKQNKWCDVEAFRWHKNTLFVRKKMRAKSLPITMEALRPWAPHIESALAQGGCFSPPRRLGIKERCVFPSLTLRRSSASSKQRNTRESQSPSLPPPSSPEDDLFDKFIKCCACSGQQRHLQTSSTSQKQQWAFVAKFLQTVDLFIH